MKAFLRWLLLALCIPALVLAMFATFQRHLIYFPRKMTLEFERRFAETQKLEPFTSASGEHLGWQTARTSSTLQRLVVFHGNGGLAVFTHHFAEAAPPGWQVVLAEYPGYGSRRGSPSEKSFQETAVAVIEQLERDDLPIFLAGESIGSGVASWAASAFPEKVSGLILVTPLTNLADVAAVHYPWLPVRYILRDRFDAEEALTRYKGPAAFLIAGRDEIIPPAIGRRLHDRYSGPKILIEQPNAGHNSVDFTQGGWAPIFDFLREHAGR